MFVQPDIPVLGRQEESARLKNRLSVVGLTFIIGPPHVGKTTLLREVQETAVDQFGYQCGYGTCAGGSLGLLRGVADLYAGWLKTARYRDQVRVLWQLRRHGFPHGIARIFDEVLSVLDKSGEVKIPLAAQLIQTALRGSLSSSQTFHNPLGLHPLSATQASDLIRIVTSVSDKPVLLVVDDLERSGQIETEIERIRQFWELINEDRDIHLMISCSSPSGAADGLQRLSSEIPSAETLFLGPLTLSEDERQRLLAILRTRLPVTRGVADEHLLSLIDGFPGVLSWWFESQQAGKLDSFQDLISASRDAHKLRYSALRDQLESLAPEARRMAARAVLLPDVGVGLPLEVYRLALPPDFSEEVLQELQEQGVFDPSCEAPSFGHPLRYDAARDFFLQRSDGRSLLSVQGKELIRHLLTCLEVDALDDHVDLFYLEALAHIGGMIEGLNLPEPYPTLCLFAAPVLLVPDIADNPMETCKRGLDVLQEVPEALVLVGNVVQTCLDISSLKSITEDREILSLAIALHEKVESPVATCCAARCIVNSLPVESLRDEVGRYEEMEAVLLGFRRLYPDYEPLQEAYARFLRHGMILKLRDRSALEAYYRLFALGAVDDRYQTRALEIERKATRRYVNGLFHSYPLPSVVEEARTIFRRLSELMKEDRASARVAIHYTQAAKLFIDYTDRIDEKEAIIAELRSLARIHKDHELVSAALVYALYRRMIYDFLRGDVGRRELILKEIRSIAWSFRESYRVLRYSFFALIDAQEYNKELTGGLRGSWRYFHELLRLSKANDVVRHLFAENRASRAITEMANGNDRRALFFLDGLDMLRNMFDEDETILGLWIFAMAELLGSLAKKRLKERLGEATRTVGGESREIKRRLIEQVRARWGGRAARAVRARLGPSS